MHHLNDFVEMHLIYKHGAHSHMSVHEIRAYISHMPQTNHSTPSSALFPFN